MIISARSNQSILKEINPEYTLEVLMLKLKLQYFGHLMWWQARHWKRPSCWERLKAGGEGADRGSDGWMASLTQWTWVWVNSRGWWWTGRLGCCSPWVCKESDITEGLNWTVQEPMKFCHLQQHRWAKRVFCWVKNVRIHIFCYHLYCGIWKMHECNKTKTDS